MSDSPKLFLLDGMALIYRAHFALIQSPIRNSKGINTSALYGFTNTLLSILEKEQPTHIGVAFDTSEPTPRHIKYPAYKAQRDEMPEELAAAIPHVKKLCSAFRIPVLEMNGYEADDIIGTLVKCAEPEGITSYMVTPDKDFAQLISPTTFMWKPGRKGGEHDVVGMEQLPEIWGVEKPEHIIDLLGLMGDTSDNIPGVPGIGPKTAVKLIANFGSIENLLSNTDQLKGKQRENVETHSDEALLSKDLATIIIDVPIEVSWDELRLTEPDMEAVQALFNEFEFRTLSKRVFGADTKASVSITSADAEEQATLFESLKTLHDVDHNYQMADSPEKVDKFLKELGTQKSFCFDIETTSLDRFGAKLLGIAFSWKAQEGWYLPLDGDPPKELLNILQSSSEKIGHNLKYDLSVLAHHGIEVKGPFFDTLLADTLIAPERRHGMDYLAEILLGYSPVKLADIAAPAKQEAAEDDLFSMAAKKKASKDLNISAIPLETLAEYAAEDADVTFQLAGIIRGKLEETDQKSIYEDIEGPLLPVLVRMEMQGIACDPNSLKEIGSELQQRIDQLAESIQSHAEGPFNIGSPKQLGEVLFNQLKLVDKPKKTKTGQFKTDEQTLSALRGVHPIIEDILAWRESSKLKSTYLDALPQHIQPQTGRIHTHFHQLVAATGRLASSDPNLQNIPIRSEAGRQIRKAFVPAQGCTLLACDYSQIELRIMAAIANDATMIEAFRQGTDVHSVTASKVFGVSVDEVSSEQRRRSKMVNFGIIYGISAFGLSQRLGIPRGEAAEIINAYFREYPAIKTFMDDTINVAREVGYAETLCGRRREFPDLTSSNQNIRNNAERAAINMPIQGTAADMIKLAMIRIDNILTTGSYKSRMLLQVHDELVFDLCIDEQEELTPKIIEIMEGALVLPHETPVKVTAGMGDHWLQAH